MSDPDDASIRLKVLLVVRSCLASQVPKARWQECQACQRRMVAEGLEDEAALQSWFIRRIGDWLQARGRQLVGWDEILEGGVESLTSDAIVMSWRVRFSC